VAVPSDDAGWRQLIRAGQPPAWELIAEATGGRVVKRDGVVAAIVPAVPGRSLFNSVFYDDGEALLESLPELAAAYEEAGVIAWTVWVPEADRETAAALERAGHALDGNPRDMGMELSALRDPGPDPELEIVEREDYATLARINEIAYGDPPGDYNVVERTKVPDFRIYFGRLDGADVATVGIAAHHGDAIVEWVAVLPEARGRGISGRLLARALSDAREAGLETTTLQSSPLGYPVYVKLGYRDYGVVQMWERRRGCQPPPMAKP
jgi:GNAT superfamily N-acetyltransferase